MSKTEVVSFLKRNFQIEIELNELDPSLWKEFEAAVLRARPSRLDNVLELEVMHRSDLHIPMMIQSVCEKGVKSTTLRTVYPIPSKIAKDPRAYMLFEYQDGYVIDQWTEMSLRQDEADDFMIDVMKIAFDHKDVTDCVWQDDAIPFAVVAGTGHSA